MEFEFLPEHHAIAPPSSWGRIGLCAGSARAQAMVPETKKHREAGKRGTLLHHKAITEESTEGLTDYDAHIVRKYWEMRGPRPQSADVHVYTEFKLAIHGPGGEVLTYGKTDELWVHQRKRFAELTDLKTHRTTLPEYSTSAQLTAYATGIFHRHPEVDRIVARAIAPAEEAVYTREFTRAELGKYERFALWVVERAKRGGERTPGWEQCQWCRAKGTPYCPESMELAQAESYVVDAPGMPRLPSLVCEQTLKLYGLRREPLILRHDGAYEIVDDEALAIAWGRVTAAIRALEAWKDQVKEAFRVGGFQSEYLQMVERGGDRNLERAAMTIDDLPAGIRTYLSEENLREATKTSVAQLEEIFAENYKAAGGKSKAEGARFFRETIEPHINRGEPSVVLQFRRGKKPQLQHKE